MREINLTDAMQGLMSDQVWRETQLPGVEVPTAVHKLQIDRNLELAIVKQPVELPHEWIEIGTDLVRDWSDWAIKQEQTWISQNHGIASPIMRIDGTLVMNADGLNSLVPYEVETRPSGVGIASMLSTEFRTRLDAVMSWWPQQLRQSDIVVAPDGIRLDDHLWLEGSEITPEEAGKSETLILVRNNSLGIDTNFCHLRERAIAPVTTDGLKTHAASRGMAAIAISVEEVKEWTSLMAGSGIVIKPIKGAYSNGVSVHSAGSKQFRPRGTVTESRLIRDATALIERDGSVLVQPLLPPLASGIPSHPNQVLRLFWANNLVDGKWIPLGGVAVSRDNIRVHGASDSVTQPAEIIGAPPIMSKDDAIAESQCGF